MRWILEAFRRATPRRVSVALAGAVLAGWLIGCGTGGNPTQPIIGPPLSSLTINVQIDTLSFGEQQIFTVTAVDTNGVTVEIQPAWRSSNIGVFTVDGSGRVMGQGEGTATLTAEAGGQLANATLTVLPGAGWLIQTSGVSATLNGVYFLTDGRRGWAVGSGGRIVATQDAGFTWNQQPSNTVLDLNAVWFTSSSSGWAVGANGTVRRTVNGGATWQVVITGVAIETLNDIAFADPDTGYAVGAAGVIVRTVDGGDTWTRSTPTALTLHSVSLANARDVWAVGDNGVIVGTHDAGTTWFTVTPAVTAQTLNAVWRRSESRAWAAGDVGVVPRTTAGPDSTVWILGNAGASEQFHGVCFPSDLIGYVVGTEGVGVVLRTDNGGLTWQEQTPNTQFRLNDVFFIDPLRGWAVGNNGAIVHTASGGLD